MSPIERWFHEAVEPFLPLLDLLINYVVIALLAYFLTVKGLNLRRETNFGHFLSDNNLAIALGYLGALLALFLAFFTQEPWRYFIRLLIVFTTVRVVVAMKDEYGGWLELHRRAFLNGLVMVAEGVEWVALRWKAVTAAAVIFLVVMVIASRW